MSSDLPRIVDFKSARQARSVPPIDVAVEAFPETSAAREADHRIANHLSLISGLVSLQAFSLARQPHDPSRIQVQLLLQGVRAQLEAAARLHRLLVTHGRSAAVDLAKQLHEVCELLSSILSGQARIVEELEAGCVVRSDQVLPLTHIVSEMLTNAIKYAHPAGAPGAILVRCRRDRIGSTVVEIEDDGVGLPEAFDPARDGGLGFRMVRRLSVQLGAKIAFKSSRLGLRFQLTLPAVTL